MSFNFTHGADDDVLWKDVDICDGGLEAHVQLGTTLCGHVIGFITGSARSGYPLQQFLTIVFIYML